MRYGTHRKIIKRSHGFRKFVNTQMVEAGLDPINRKMLLGHDIGLDRSYYKPSKTKMPEEYLNAVNLLTINPEHRLQNKIAILEKKQDDIEMLKIAYLSKEKRTDELEQQMKEFMLIARDRLKIRDNLIKRLQDKQPNPTKEEIQQKLKELGFKKSLAAFNKNHKESR